MPIPDKIVNQRSIFLSRLGSIPVRDARRLHYGGIIAHVIDDADEPQVENSEVIADDSVYFWN